MSTFPVLLDGYTELPPGKIANVVTFLEMTSPTSASPKEMPGLTVVHVDHPQPNWYRDLYQRIGEQWLWFSRAIMSDKDLAALLHERTTHILVARKDGADMGLAELDYSVPGEVEIAMFGVVPEAVGTGIAYILMASALAYAFKEKPRRVWLHTCTFDHPRALGFYRRNGFSPYKFAIEVSDDPRNTGHLPKTAAPQVPLLGDRQ